jgi:hypothetical protein
MTDDCSPLAETEVGCSWGNLYFIIVSRKEKGESQQKFGLVKTTKKSRKIPRNITVVWGKNTAGNGFRKQNPHETGISTGEKGGK